ncbi:MAG: hypothetical protein NWF04_03025 [Candidatus Bathyarchaeota archaeon]|nr:hypothetical protein [Candidatus Bathyarchaeota archaeon]
MEKLKVITKLLERDFLIGTLAQEAEECYEENKGLAAFACLVILVEQVTKFSINKTEGNFRECLAEAVNKKVITQEEFELLDQLRDARNKFFHEYHYAMFWEENNVLWPFSENDTRLHVYEIYAEQCFQIALRLIEG